VADNVKDAFCLGDFVLRLLLRQYALGKQVCDTSAGVEALETYRVRDTLPMFSFSLLT
jgi:hypothetical protein